MEWRVVLGTLMLVQCIVQVSSKATLLIQMITFKNSNERDWNGKYCDWLGAGKCDHLFEFCIDTSTSGDQSVDSSCEYYHAKTAEFPDDNENDFSQNMNGVANPIRKSFNNWPTAGVKFKIEVYDDDTGHSGHDKVDLLRYNLVYQPSRSESQAIWQQKLIRGFRTRTDKTSASFKFKLYCDEFYFGSDCSVYCKAADSDWDGHYTCHPTTGAIQCLTGWEGNKCDIVANDCLSNPCMNGGTCVDKVQAYTCECPPGFTGTECQVNINECHSGPCQYGDCIDMINGYRCICKPSYVGQNCNLDVCQDVGATYCMNNGTCAVVDSTTNCVCTEDFKGERCEHLKCESVNCQNGGTCKAGECTCSLGFVGSVCGVDLCAIHPCHNGGSCTDGKCECANGAHGRYCEFACSDTVCKNDGTCVNNNGDGYNCLCLPRFNGTNCQLLIPEPLPDETSPEEELPAEDMEDNAVPEPDDTVKPTATSKPEVAAAAGSGNNDRRLVAQAFPSWIIILVVLLLLIVLIVILASVVLVKRYRRKARRAEDAVVQMEHSDGMTGCSNPVYVASPMGTNVTDGAIGPAVFFHPADIPPPYKEKMENEDPAYSQIGGATGGATSATKTKTEPCGEVVNHYDNPLVMEPTYDTPRPLAGAEAAGSVDEDVVPPLPMKQKDMGEQAPPLPDKQRL